jgi:hypothetical protein
MASFTGMREYDEVADGLLPGLHSQCVSAHACACVLVRVRVCVRAGVRVRVSLHMSSENVDTAPSPTRST